MPNDLTGNKGEWSEFYTLLKVLAEQKLYSADANLQILENIFYPVLRVISAKNTANEVHYDLTKDTASILIYNPRTNSFHSIERDAVRKCLPDILKAIKEAGTGTFSIDLAGALFEKLERKNITAKCSNKADIFLVIHDRNTGIEPEIGFSIKSELGASPTLLNASGATNFIYEIVNPIPDIERLNDIDTHSKVRDRLSGLILGGSSLKYVGMSNDTFKSNLMKIDSYMPSILADMLVIYYSGLTSGTVAEVTKTYEDEKNKSGDAVEKGFYEFKIKNLLMYSALGMMPSTKWDGLLEAHGGYLIVREDGEIVCYHIYNQDQFREYLYKNTRFETPATHRHAFGSVYKDGDKYYIKLNLQIRFTR